MTTATWTGDELENYKETRKGDLPDVILVRKVIIIILLNFNIFCYNLI